MATEFADSLITRLLQVHQTGDKEMMRLISEAEVARLLVEVRNVLMSQPSLVEVDPPIKICGDVHGQYADLIRLFGRAGFPPSTNYLFLGDYVDRGKQNLETICLMFSYKLRYPNNFFMLRGNHECHNINRAYGFFAECEKRLKNPRIYQAFNEVFCCLPFCGLVGGKIFCMHGGLSQKIQSFNQVRDITRPQEPANPSMEMDLLWADPDQWASGYKPNTRGVSSVFGQDVVADFCSKMGVDLIARAHQVVQDGYEFFGNRRLVTLFSAPHYCGEFDNAAGVMKVAEDLNCSFEILRPTHKRPA